MNDDPVDRRDDDPPERRLRRAFIGVRWLAMLCTAIGVVGTASMTLWVRPCVLVYGMDTGGPLLLLGTMATLLVGGMLWIVSPPGRYRLRLDRLGGVLTCTGALFWCMFIGFGGLLGVGCF